MPFCRQCGTEVQLKDLFCAKCGEQQTSVPQGTQEAVSLSRDEHSLIQDLHYKGVGIRFVAQLVDAVICLIILVIMGSIVASMVGGTTPDGFEITGTPAVVAQVLTGLLSILYFSLLEAYWNGQTLGKKITRIQVLNEDGTNIDLATALIRNTLRVVDVFGFYLVAAISVWMSPRKQRIGDRFAQTCVVKKRVTPGDKQRSLR